MFKKILFLPILIYLIIPINIIPKIIFKTKDKHLLINLFLIIKLIIKLKLFPLPIISITFPAKLILNPVLLLGLYNMDVNFKPNKELKVILKTTRMLNYISLTINLKTIHSPTFINKNIIKIIKKSIKIKKNLKLIQYFILPIKHNKTY